VAEIPLIKYGVRRFTARESVATVAGDCLLNPRDSTEVKRGDCKRSTRTLTTPSKSANLNRRLDRPSSRTGALNLQFTFRNTVPGPGRSSATTALRMALVMLPCTTMPPDRVRLARSASLYRRLRSPLMAVKSSIRPSPTTHERSTRCPTTGAPLARPRNSSVS